MTVLAFYETKFFFQYGAASRCLAQKNIPRKIEVRECDANGCLGSDWLKPTRAMICDVRTEASWEL